MDLSTIANLINAGAVTAGLIFAAVQIRHYRQQRQRDTMLELVRTFQSPAFTRALHQINLLPDSADRARIREILGAHGEESVFLVGLTWETLGVLVFRREVTLDLVADFFSGGIIISWRHLHAFVAEDRLALKRETVWEWFQWLAEKMIEREKANPRVPAHIAHRDWR